MAQQETITLDIVIDQSQAMSALDSAKNRVTALKTEELNLNKAFKAGQLTQKEYAQETAKTSTQLTVEQNSVKKLSSELKQNKAVTDDATKAQTALDNQLKKTPKSIQSLTGSFSELSTVGQNASKAFGEFATSAGDAAKGINIAGVSVGDIASKLTTSAGLIGGAIALVGALGTAYASSAEGARDLAFASDLASAATSTLADAIGETVAGLGDQTGQVGVFSGIVTGLLFQLDSGLAVASIAKATAQQTLRQIELSLKFAQAFAKDDERRAENARRIRDDEDAALDERLKKTFEIDNALDGSGKRTIAVLQAQIKAIKEATTNYGKNLEAQLRVASVEAEIADKQEEINGKLTENITARRAILKLIEEEAKFQKALAAANTRASTAPAAQKDRIGAQFGTTEGDDTARRNRDIQSEKETLAALQGVRRTAGEQQIVENAAIQDGIVAYNQAAYLKDLENKKKSQELKKQLQNQELQLASSTLGSIAGLFKEDSEQRKIFATGQALINSYLAATAALASGSEINPVFGIVSAAAAVAAGLAQVAAINGVEFAEGGYTGKGNKYDVAGVVHKGEYVVPKHIVESKQASPYIRSLEAQRLRGYADGGFVTNETVSQSQVALITANAIKNLPPPVVGVEEVTRVQKRIAAREKTSRL